MSSDTISNLSELEKYINSFIDEKYAFFHQEALDIYSALVEDNFSYNKDLKENLYRNLKINQDEYKNKIKEYLVLNNYNDREIISLIKNLDTFYNQCFERSILLKNNLEKLNSTITNDNKSDVKLKMLKAINYEMEKYIGILLRGERNMLQEKLKINIPDVRLKVKSMSGGQRQSIAIARCVFFNARVIILDEPTAALGVEETRKVYLLIQEMKAQGRSVLIISHNMNHVFENCDRITILKTGTLIGSKEVKNTTQEEIVRMIVSGSGS
jgi:ABC-type oligopeptide transport system ATPase subunit